MHYLCHYIRLYREKREKIEMDPKPNCFSKQTVHFSDIKKIEETLGGFAETNPKTVSTEEVYQRIKRNFNSKVVESRLKSCNEIAELLKIGPIFNQFKCDAKFK